MAETAFESLAEQQAAATRGMWTFLASEVLFFGGMLAVYTVYRLQYPGAFRAGSRREELTLGAINTAILLTSSFAVAISSEALARGKRVACNCSLIIASGLGCVFLIIKGVEYAAKAHAGLVPGPHFSGAPPQMELFFALYFMMTGLHALHLIIGIVALVVMAFRKAQIQLENVALYWHFVDAIWVLLFPLFYLVR